MRKSQPSLISKKPSSIFLAKNNRILVCFISIVMPKQVNKKSVITNIRTSLIPIKENIDSNITNNISKKIALHMNHKSTLKSFYKRAVPMKPRKDKKIIHKPITNIKSIIKTTKDKKGRKQEKQYLLLFNTVTNQSERFRLYKDIDIGFEIELQDSIKEIVSIVNRVGI